MQRVREFRWLPSACCLGALLALASACGIGENGSADARRGDASADAGADHGGRDVAGDGAVDVADVADVANDAAAADTSVDLCVGVVCSALDACHSVGVCEPSTGQCSNPAAADGTACDDGNACTQSDTCQAGTCTGANPVTCTASDQCHDVGTCNPATGTCSNPAAANSTACNDGNACTQSDTCQAGTCTGANPVTCAASDQCHDVGTCNPATGTCSNPSRADGTACNDGLTCTSGDTCTAGTCGGTPPPGVIDQSQTSFDSGNVVFDCAQSFTPAASGRMTTLTLFKNGLSGTQSITLEVRLGSGVGGALLYTGVHVLPDVTGPTTVTLSSVLNLTAGNVYTFRIIDPSESFGTLGQTGNPYARGAWVYDTAYGDYFIDQQFDLWFETTMAPACP